MLKYYKAIYSLSLEDLRRAATLKLETTNNHYSDMFIITAKAAGNEIKKPKQRAKKQLPEASFDTLASFIGAM